MTVWRPYREELAVERITFSKRDAPAFRFSGSVQKIPGSALKNCVLTRPTQRHRTPARGRAEVTVGAMQRPRMMDDDVARIDVLIRCSNSSGVGTGFVRADPEARWHQAARAAEESFGGTRNLLTCR